MIKTEKEHGIIDMLIEGINYISRTISSSIFPQITESMNNIDNKIIAIEKRIIRKIYSLLTIVFGGVLLIFTLFFFLREFLNWSYTLAFFSIGIIIFVIGLLLKIGESNG